MARLEPADGGTAEAGPAGRLRRLVWLLVLLAGIVIYQIVLRVMIDTKNVNFSRPCC